jgi:exopolysaccharide biosynthesis protein
MKMNKKILSNKTIKILILSVVVSSVCLYAGHFLFSSIVYYDNFDEKPESKAENEKGIEKVLPVKHIHITEEIKGNRQEINMIEVDLSQGSAEVLPVLSHDKLFGFEKLSDMALRSNAFAAVNAGFFYEYGEPSGMVAIDGEVITMPTGKYPVLIIRDNKAHLKEMNVKIWLETPYGRFDADRINNTGRAGETVVYTPAFGYTSRVNEPNITAVIENEVVIGINRYGGEVEIPDNGMLLTLLQPFKYGVGELPLKPGDRVVLRYEPELGAESQAYECGSWIVKDGKVVIEDRDEWVGVLTNRDPRTAVGLKDEQTIVLFTVDGRQPGYSEGLTGKELGGVLLKYGIKDAAMLDGGASTAMMVKGKLVNRPSFKGQERPLGGAIVVRIKK